MKIILTLPKVIITLVLLLSTGINAKAQDANRAKMLARAAELEIKTEYKAVPGDALSHHTAGFAKIMCSAIFITCLTPESAAENVGYFTSPYAERLKVGKPLVDYTNKTVSITLPNGVIRKAIYTGSQGCVTLPEGVNSLVVI